MCALALVYLSCSMWAEHLLALILCTGPQVHQMKRRYEIGLEKLLAAEADVNVMKQELIELQPKLVETGGWLGSPVCPPRLGADRVPGVLRPSIPQLCPAPVPVCPQSPKTHVHDAKRAAPP